jgi:hypothetical protein
MTEVFLTPTDGADAVELSSTLFRKKILPKGTIDYKGRKITFDDAYLADLAASYKDGAYDQVAVQMADKDNAHTLDPDRFRGEVKGVEAAVDGLYATMELSAAGADAVRANPKLGVSARIVEQYDRADGKSYPRAMQHVLMTLDPRLTGLGAWEEVALSGYDASSVVLDLTTSTYEGAPTVAKTEDGTVDGLTKAEYDALMVELGIDPADLEEGDETDDAGITDKGEGVNAPAGAAEQTKEPAVAALSNEDRTALDLANTEIETLKRLRAEDAFKAEKRLYTDKGVPPALVELARPVLTAPDGFTIDLSNGTDGTKSVDAGAIIRQILDSSVGYIELARERGHSVDFSQETGKDSKDPDAEALAMWAELDKKS